MKVNYVLMYGIPYVRYKEFETFEDISKFLVHKCYVNYSIFKKLEDKEEIEMIYRDNDIHYLEDFVKKQDKEIERLNNIINELDKQNGELGAELSIIKDRVIKTNWWLENMLKQATNKETKAIINGTLDLLLGSDKE